MRVKSPPSATLERLEKEIFSEKHTVELDGSAAQTNSYNTFSEPEGDLIAESFLEYVLNETKGKIVGKAAARNETA